MKHLFLNKELSLLAKEKGFNEHCFAQYTDGTLDSTETIYPQEYVEVIPAPLYQQIIDWFREKHNIHIWIDHECSQMNGQWGYNWYVEDDNKDELYDCVPHAPAGEWVYKEYYEALDKAIEQAFKLI